VFIQRTRKTLDSAKRQVNRLPVHNDRPGGPGGGWLASPQNLLALQRLAGNRATSNLLSSDSSLRVQRQVFGVPGLEVVELVAAGMGVAQVAQNAHTMTRGGFSYSSAEASRMLDRPQPRARNYERQVLDIGFASMRGSLNASFVVSWEGNDFGEIGAAYVRPEPGYSEFNYSELNVRFTALKSLPTEGDDPRSWPLRFTYDGHFDPVGAGEFDFQGEFQIDAFGSYDTLSHSVEDRTTFAAINIGDWDAYDVIGTGFPRFVAPRPMPPNARLAPGAGPAQRGPDASASPGSPPTTPPR
jgi:hypothetical protein